MNSLYMQGHSHVNMVTSPSGTDLEHQRNILRDINSSQFYIFLIWNKRDEKSIWIYDFAKNILFETPDVTVKLLDDGMGLQSFLRDARGMVQSKTYAPAPVSYCNRSAGQFASCGTGMSGGVYRNSAPVSLRGGQERDGSAAETGGIQVSRKRKKKKKLGATYPPRDDYSPYYRY